MNDLFGVEKIRTLGLYQPFATAMLCGKDIETRWVLRDTRKGSGRRRKAPFPLGKYCFYACKRAYPNSEVMEISGQYFESLIKATKADPSISPKYYGQAIAIGELVKVCDWLPGMGPQSFVDYSLDAMEQDLAELDADQINEIYRMEQEDPDNEDTHILTALIFQDIKRIRPFQVKGKQGIGFLTSYQKEQIEIITTNQY